MQNKQLANHLDTIANYYIVAKDSSRCHAFRNAARNVELVTFEIQSDNIEQVKFKGLGKSTTQTIEEFIQTKSSSRLKKLQEQLPPPTLLPLLELYNFDLEQITLLWNKYKISKPSDLSRVTEPSVTLAELVKNNINNIELQSFSNNNYRLLGDGAIISSYSAGENSVEELAEHLSELEDKHLFIANYLESNNVLYGMKLENLKYLKQNITDAQLNNNVKIFSGAIIDIDLEGLPIAPLSAYSEFDYIIFKLSTAPHTNIISRLDRALKIFESTERVIIDILDEFSLTALDSNQIQQLISKYKVPILLAPKNLLQASVAYQLLRNIKLDRVLLGTKATSIDQLANLTISGDLAMKLSIPEDKILNCQARPFEKIYTKNTVGVK